MFSSTRTAATSNGPHEFTRNDTTDRGRLEKFSVKTDELRICASTPEVQVSYALKISRI